MTAQLSVLTFAGSVLDFTKKLLWVMSKGSKSFVATKQSQSRCAKLPCATEPLERFEQTIYWEASMKHIARIMFMLFAFASPMMAQVTTCKNFENVRCVDSANAAGWSGTDFVGWVNSAYADCPSTDATFTSQRVVTHLARLPEYSSQPITNLQDCCALPRVLRT
jgi:hypothetical protein